MEFIVRQATPADAQAVVRLAFKLLKHEGDIDFRNKVSQPKALKESIIDKLSSDPTRAWFLAWVGNKAVGVARVQLNDNKIGPKRGYFSFLFVEPQYRRKGIASELTRARVQWLKKRRVKFVVTEILPSNKASLANLKKYNPEPWYQQYTFEI